MVSEMERFDKHRSQVRARSGPAGLTKANPNRS
jgi:hypothetical protein